MNTLRVMFTTAHNLLLIYPRIMLRMHMLHTSTRNTAMSSLSFGLHSAELPSENFRYHSLGWRFRSEAPYIGVSMVKEFDHRHRRRFDMRSVHLSNPVMEIANR